MKAIRIAMLLTCILGMKTFLHAQNGEQIFNDNCTACHTVGGGKIVGPDLKGVHEKRSADWLIKFIQSSQSLIKSGDMDAKAIFDEFNGVQMPDQPLSDADVQAIIAYIETQGPAEGGAVVADGEMEEDDTPEPTLNTADATKEEIEKGMKLFTGEISFANGGVGCISCHNVYNDEMIGGGRLAKDLTEVHQRMGDMGISGILTSPPFPAMADSYRDRPLTEDEIYLLASFLNYAGQEGVYQHPRSWDWVFVFGGGGILFLFLCWIFMVYFKRKKKSTKHDILARQGYYAKIK